MEYTELGTTGVEVSAMGLGCMGFSGSYGPADEAESQEVIRRAAELGATLFDTGDFYGGGENERLLGRALAALDTPGLIANATARPADALPVEVLVPRLIS